MPDESPFAGIRLLETIDLAGSVPERAELVGVAVAPDGERYVLDSASGLYHLGETGSERVLDSQQLDERYGLSPELELTDVVSYGPDRFLITAENDGFLLDLWAGTMESYFCYLPPIGPDEPFEQDPLVPVSVSQVLSSSGVPVKQRTESVAVNSRTGEIFAQPQTLRLDAAASRSDPAAPDAAIAGSELFVFDSAGGEPSRVQPVDANFLAGGMVAWANRLFLGFGDGMFEMTVDGPRWTGAFPPGTVVTGLALDVDGSLLALDGPARRLLRFELTP